MRFLLYNPLVRLIGWLWWLPVLSLLVTYGIGGEQGLRTAARGLGIGVTFLAGAVGAMALHSTLAVGRRKLRRRHERHRFLCPECLRFAPVQYACAGCGNPLSETLPATQGLYVSHCPECDYPVMNNGVPTLLAHCIHCHLQGDTARWHGHRVHAVATLLPEDYVVLCRKYGIVNAKCDEELTWIVDEQTTFLLINLSAGTFLDPLPADHALRHLDALWISGIETDILALGQSADRFLRHLGENAFTKDNIICFVEQLGCDPAVKNMLSARFGNITFNMQSSEPSAVLETAAATPESKTTDQKSEVETSVRLNTSG